MNSTSYYSQGLILNLDLDKSKIYEGEMYMVVVKYISPAKISVIVPKTVNASIMLKPNFNKYFRIGVDGIDCKVQECSRFFSKTSLSSLNLENNQVLEIIVKPENVEYDKPYNFQILSVEIA